MNNIIQVKNECFDEPYCEIGNICKQLQGKEQECEELRGVMRKDICSHYVLGECSQKHHNNCVGRNQCIKDLEKECERWKSNFNGKVSAIEELLKQLDQLKAERDLLKQECDNWEQQVLFADEQIDKMQDEIHLLQQYKKSKQASYESMQEQWQKAVSQNQDLLKQNEEWQKQVKELKAEKEELNEKKEENTTFYFKKYANKDSECLELQHKVNVLSQILIEIKEIAKFNWGDKNMGFMCNQILQKISEVEDATNK